MQLFHFKKATLNKQMNDLKTFFWKSDQSDQLRILAAVESFFKHFFKHKEIQL
jgi:hypothetical protein